MKAFASQMCLGVCVLLVGCGGDDDGSATSSTTGAGGGFGVTTSASGGSGGAGTAGEAGAAGAPGCDSPPVENDLEIAGVYRDSYDAAHRVDDEVWQMGSSTFELLDFSNEERWAIAENAADNEFFPDSFSRFEWTHEAGKLFYCQSVFAASSAADARDEPRADADDLLAGCGGFPWSALVPIALIGSYEDDFGGSHTISASLWQMGTSSFHLLEFSNGQRWAVAQNDCANAYFPGLYSRFDWMMLPGGEGGAAGAAGAAGAGGAGAGEESGRTYYCQTGYDVESAEAARELEAADTADLAEGCNGFPWSLLSPQDL